MRLSCELNDGFCKVNGCIVDTIEKVEKQRLDDYVVIRVTKSGMQRNKKQKIVVVVEGYEVVTRQVTALVGSPIPYEEYIKNGKNNPNGDNLVHIAKGAQKTKKESKSVDHEPFEESKSNI